MRQDGASCQSAPNTAQSVVLNFDPVLQALCCHRRIRYVGSAVSRTLASITQEVGGHLVSGGKDLSDSIGANTQAVKGCLVNRCQLAVGFPK